MNTKEILAAYRERVNAHLDRIIAREWGDIPHPLSDAMAYSLQGGGKRLRPALLLAAHDLIAPSGEDAMRFAGAVEMIHTYSLIHDDLPAMDNDTLRRGRPTCHVVYGEAMAILAGDGLLSLAMEEMLGVRHPRAAQAAWQIARGAGVRGMVAGQCLDLANEGRQPTEETVSAIHLKKTACLIQAPILAGLILAGADGDRLAAAERFGRCFGLAFQIQDDLLDLTGDEAAMGKHLGKDAAVGKQTWPAVFGEEQARRDMESLTRDGCDALRDAFGAQAAFLCAVAQECVSRRN